MHLDNYIAASNEDTTSPRLYKDERSNIGGTGWTIVVSAVQSNRYTTHTRATGKLCALNKEKRRIYE